MLKLKAKYGKANAKLSTSTLNSEAMIPYTKPSVNLDTKNTAIAITAGGTVSAENFVSNKKHRADWEYPGRDVGMFERGRFKGHKTTVTY